jgi:hypothetical protein
MGDYKMAYLYTNEETLTVAIMISLQEMDTVIRILDPIADDEKHAVRHRASDLNRKFKDGQDADRPLRNRVPATQGQRSQQVINQGVASVTPHQRGKKMTYTIENPADPRVQAIFLKAHLKMLSIGLKGRNSGTKILAAASKITGTAYKRGQYTAALQDIEALLTQGE